MFVSNGHPPQPQGGDDSDQHRNCLDTDSGLDIYTPPLTWWLSIMWFMPNSLCLKISNNPIAYWVMVVYSRYISARLLCFASMDSVLWILYTYKTDWYQYEGWCMLSDQRDSPVWWYAMYSGSLQFDSSQFDNSTMQYSWIPTPKLKFNQLVSLIWHSYLGPPLLKSATWWQPHDMAEEVQRASHCLFHSLQPPFQ